MYDLKDFKAADHIPALLDWMRAQMKSCGGKTAVVGISGGKDSSVIAALCVEAYGRENVVGVLMPDGVQPDIDYSNGIVDFLGIKHYTFNIHGGTSGILGEMTRLGIEASRQTTVNLPSRINDNGKTVWHTNYGITRRTYLTHFFARFVGAGHIADKRFSVFYDDFSNSVYCIFPVLVKRHFANSVPVQNNGNIFCGLSAQEQPRDKRRRAKHDYKNEIRYAHTKPSVRLHGFIHL